MIFKFKKTISKIISIYFLFLAIYSMRNVLFPSQGCAEIGISYRIISWIGTLIFTLPCIISSIAIWKGLKRKWIKNFSLITAIIYEILFLLGTIVCLSLFFRFHHVWIRFLLALIALLFNTFVIYWISTQKAVKVKESNNICDK